MKRKTILGICAAILTFTIPLTSFAYLEPTGPTTSSDEGVYWLQTQQTQILVEQMLEDNIAFADGSKKAWVNDGIVEMNTPAVFDVDNRCFNISGDFVRGVLGLSINGDVISTNTIATSGKYKTHFIDPRGFCLLSQSENAVDTNNYGNMWLTYQDAYNVAAAIGTLNWDDVTFTEEDYEKFLSNWETNLLAPEGYGEKMDEAVNAHIKSAEEIRSKIQLGENGEGPFTDLYVGTGDPYSNHVNVYTMFQRIFNMATAYALGGRTDTEFRDDILDCLEYMYVKHYSRKMQLIQSGGNWTYFYWDIPYYYTSALCLMRHDMTYEDIKKHTNALFDRVADPTVKVGNMVSQKGASNPMTVTNRLWATLPWLCSAVLAKDEERINYAMRYVNEPFFKSYRYSCDYLMMSPDGYYDDGSMVFHSSVAYNTGYGQSYIRMVANYLLLTENTPIDIRKVHNFDNVYDFIIPGMIPFTVENNIMKHTSGRHWPNEAERMIPSIMVLINRMEEPDKSIYAAELKKVIADYEEDYRNAGGADFSGGWGANAFTRYKEVQDFLNYAENIDVTADTGTKINVYNSMNKAVMRAEDFTASIGMSSERIQKYESLGSGEGLREWYINDGTVFVYTGDEKQFTRQYLDNMNHYYMPGTTVDQTVRKEVLTSESTAAKGSNKWAGGVTDGKSGTVSMILGNDYVSGLEGRKSYFMFGDKIVCIGSGITGGNGNVYTTVDNRIIDKSVSEVEGMSSITDMFASVVSISDSAGTPYNEGAERDLAFLTDGNVGTVIASDVLGWYMDFDLGEETELDGVAISFGNGNKRKEYFDIEYSKDGVNYTEIYSGESSGTTLNPELFSIPCKARYIRIVANGNSLVSNDWFNIAEVRFVKAGYDRSEILYALDLPETGFDDVVVDGELTNVDFNTPHIYEDARYVCVGDNYGYVMLDGDVCIERYVGKTYKAVWCTLSINHGVSPVNEGYSYIMLPGATNEETKEYAAQPDVEIIENTENIHCVYDKKTGIIAANVFGSGDIKGIDFKTPCAVMIKPDVNEIIIADPTVSSSKIEFELPDNITLEYNKYITRNGNKITLDISSDKSKMYVLKFSDVEKWNNVNIKKYHIKAKGLSFNTQLIAYDKSNSTVFRIIDSCIGNAEIEGDILHYTSADNTDYNDIVNVGVYTKDNVLIEVIKINIIKTGGDKL